MNNSGISMFIYFDGFASEADIESLEEYVWSRPYVLDYEHLGVNYGQRCSHAMVETVVNAVVFAQRLYSKYSFVRNVKAYRVTDEFNLSKHNICSSDEGRHERESYCPQISGRTRNILMKY